MSKTRKKSTPAAAKRKVTAAKKKVSAVRKKVTRKPAKRSTAKKRVTSSDSSHAAVGHIAGSALKLVDQAASLLRTGIRTGASQTEKAHLETKRRALALVNKASDHLNKAVKASSGGIRSIIGRI